MNNLEPINQTKLFGLKKYFLDLIRIYKKDIFPTKIMLSGQKGIGKCTLAYHFINYVLSFNENNNYDLVNLEINPNSSVFKTILNKSNPNLITVDILPDKKTIDINQIRELIINLNKSSFNNKPRFVLIDNIELLNKNSINALLKILEEPNHNIFFILIHNNKRVLSTLLSRCIDYKVNLTNNECLYVSSMLLNKNLEEMINYDFIDYYFTPGDVCHLVKFANKFNLDLLKLNLNKFLKILIKESYYKKDPHFRFIMYSLIEFYFRKLSSSFSKKVNNKYNYFIRRISETKTFNLDEESLLMEFEKEILNG